MTVLRWILFLPALILVSTVTQMIGGFAGEAGPWWIWGPLYMLVGWSITAFATYQFARICPNPKIGGWMFLGLFVVLEPLAFLGGFTDRPAAENIIRLGNDASILSGVLMAGLSFGSQAEGQ